MIPLSKQVNWKKVLFRCHCFQDILTPAKDAIKKANGEMGQTAIKRLVKVYAFEKWGREEIITADSLTKGIEQEGLGIELVNRVEGKKFVKNEERIENSFFSGIPDMFEGKDIRKAKLIADNKCPFSAQTFLENEINELKKIYDAQLHCYADLCQSPKAAVYFTLVDSPESIILKKINKLKWDMGVIDDSVDDEFKQAVAELEFNHRFDDIPEKERVIKVEVQIENQKILAAHAAAEKAREWLAEFDELRMSRYK